MIDSASKYPNIDPQNIKFGTKWKTEKSLQFAIFRADLFRVLSPLGEKTQHQPTPWPTKTSSFIFLH